MVKSLGFLAWLLYSYQEMYEDMYGAISRYFERGRVQVGPSRQWSAAEARSKLRVKEDQEPELSEELIQELRTAVIRTNTHFNHRYHRGGQQHGFYPAVDIFLNFMKKEVKQISRYDLRHIKFENVEMQVDWELRKVTEIRFEPSWNQTWEGPLAIMATLNIHMAQLDLESLPIDSSIIKELEEPMSILEKLKSFKFS